LNVADPAAVGGDAAAARIELPEFTLRPRDAMLLPLRLPLRDHEPDGEAREEVFYATAELLGRETANGTIALRFYAPDPAEVALRLGRAPQGGVTINGMPAVSAYDAQTRLLKIRIAPPPNSTRAKNADELAGRREHERDVEVVYEKDVPQLVVKPARLTLGERNRIAVEVANRTAQPLRGRLQLAVSRLFRRDELVLDAELNAREVKLFEFEMPLNENAVAGDQLRLQATLNAGATRPFVSPAAVAAVAPRFEWRVFPNNPGAKLTWPLRADAAQPIQPPLLYPSDDNATEAKFNIRFGNNAAEDITLTRQSLLVNALPVRLRPGEEYFSTFTYNFAPGEKSVLNPFAVQISDGKRTETALVNFVALRKSEAVAFAYDMDRDGFDDYVLENEHLRLIVSPNAGARAFALINKHTGQNAFTSVGGLRDRFVELDPADPTRNARRKRGMYGAFNRPYAAEIVEGMGKRVTLKLVYDAPDVFSATGPPGARIERAVVLNGGEEFFTVDYRVTPNGADGRQALWSANSIVTGDPNLQARGMTDAEGAFEFSAAKTRALGVSGGWLAATLTERSTFAVLWRPAEVQAAEVDMKEFSSLINLKFKPFAGGANAYRLVYYFGAMTLPQIAAARPRLIGE
jgi:hypothetical protein